MLSRSYPEHPGSHSRHLRDIINLNHPLCQLADQIKWSVFEGELGAFYSENQGAPAKPIRLMVGLRHLKYTYDYSNEGVVYQTPSFSMIEYLPMWLPLIGNLQASGSLLIAVAGSSIADSTA